MSDKPFYELEEDPYGNWNITEDGHTMFQQDIVKLLNRKSYLERQLKESNELLDECLGTISHIKEQARCGYIFNVANQLLAKLKERKQ